MIEKLKVVIKPEDWKLPVNELEMRCLKNLLSKMDELVDAVNELQQQVKEIMTWRFETDDEPAENGKISKMEKDPYAEQREWIGKLCWFWCTNENYADLGILQAITPANTSYKYLKKDSSIWYSNCEPVKPDDDIIYKGDDK